MLAAKRSWRGFGWSAIRTNYKWLWHAISVWRTLSAKWKLKCCLIRQSWKKMAFLSITWWRRFLVNLFAFSWPTSYDQRTNIECSFPNSSSVDVLPGRNQFSTRAASDIFRAKPFRIWIFGTIQNAFAEFDSAGDKGRYSVCIRIGIVVCRVFYIIHNRANFAILHCVQYRFIAGIRRFHRRNRLFQVVDRSSKQMRC